MENSAENPAPHEGAATGGTASADAIKEEFIAQRMKASLATGRSMPAHECLSRLSAMSTDPKVPPKVEDAVAISSQQGYNLVSLDGRPHTDPQLGMRSALADKWLGNTANKHTLALVEDLLVQEIRDTIWWLSQDEKDAISKLDDAKERVSSARFQPSQPTLTLT